MAWQKRRRHAFSVLTIHHNVERKHAAKMKKAMKNIRLKAVILLSKRKKRTTTGKWHGGIHEERSSRKALLLW